MLWFDSIRFDSIIFYLGFISRSRQRGHEQPRRRLVASRNLPMPREAEHFRGQPLGLAYHPGLDRQQRECVRGVWRCLVDVDLGFPFWGALVRRESDQKMVLEGHLFDPFCSPSSLCLLLMSRYLLIFLFFYLVLSLFCKSQFFLL